MVSLLFYDTTLYLQIVLQFTLLWPGTTASRTTSARAPGRPTLWWRLPGRRLPPLWSVLFNLALMYIVICPARWNLLSRFHHPDLMRLLLVLLILTLVLALLTHSDSHPPQGATEDKFWVYSHCILNFILHFSFFLRCDVDVEPRLGATCSSWEASLMATRASPWRWTDTEHQIFRQGRYQKTIKQREL